MVITRGCNTIGPRQYPEKLILFSSPMPCASNHCRSTATACRSRWLYVDDAAAAIDLVLRRGRAGEIYNIGAGNHRTNVEVVRFLLDYLGKPENLIVHVRIARVTIACARRKQDQI